MSKTNYLENKILDHTLGVSALTMPTPWVALFTAVADGEAGTVTEVSLTGGYARVQGTFGAATAGSTTNSATITFGLSSASLGTVTHFGIYDAATTGNLLRFAVIGSPFAYGSGVQPRFDIGALTVTED
jgi:hypothetical protein